MTGQIADCALTVCVFVLNTATVTGLLGLFGYAKRKTQAPFWAVFAALTVLQAALAMFVRDTETKKLAAELCLMGGAMGLGYLRFLPHKRMTFAWSGLLLCSAFDYAAFVVLSFLPVSGYRAELTVYAVLYAAAVLAVLLRSRFSTTRLLPGFPERVPPVLCVIVFFAAYSAYYESTLQTQPDSSAVLSAVLRVLSAALFIGSAVYMFVRYASLAARQREDAVRHALEAKRYEELAAKNRDVRAFRHDYQNNLLALSALLQGGQTAQAAAYVSSLSDQLAQTKSAYATGNLLADAILTDKAQNAKTRGIDIVFHGIVPSAGVDDRDLCVILANALDNAVEGCSGCAPCTVTATSTVKPGGWTLRIENPVPQPVVIRGGEVRTSKADAENHGYGIGNIRKTARAYNGYADIACSANTFSIEIGLVLRGEEG